MLHAKAQARDPKRRAREPDDDIERVVTIDGDAYLLAAAATEVLTLDTGFMATQAADRLRRYARDGSVRTRKLGAKLAAYHRGDVLAARSRLLTGPR